MIPFRVFVGYDPREAIAYHTLTQSLIANSSIPLAICPLALANLSDCFWREREPNQSTDFSFSRFLVPYLCNYEGWALFMDCDMLVRADIAAIARFANAANAGKAVYVVKHAPYTPKASKFLDQVNEPYPKKNWTSFMLFNNQACQVLRPDVVNTAIGPFLHRFNWLRDEQVGELPFEWNHLVGEHADNPAAANVHFTLGGPYFPAYDDGSEFSDEWWSTFSDAANAETAGLRDGIGLVRAVSNRRWGRASDELDCLIAAARAGGAIAGAD